MSRYRRYRIRSYSMGPETENSAYYVAYRKVKKIKGFYVHLFVYLVVNSIILLTAMNGTINGSDQFWSWPTLSTTFFWGIGLVGHGLSVFGTHLFFGPNWEEKKIQQLMEKEKKEQWE